MGELSAGVVLPIGSAVGQIPEAQIASQNLIIGTHAPAAAQWPATGAQNFAFNNFQWDAGFFPQDFTSTNGNAAFTSSSALPNILAASQYSVSAQVTVDPAMGLATPSAACRIAVNWTGGVAREDSVKINPATGAIVAASAGVTNIQVERFTTFSTVNNAEFSVFAVSFVTPATPVGTNAGTFRLYAADAAAGVTGTVTAGGFQVELGTTASAFISTPAITNNLRRFLGSLPRHIVDRNETYIPIAAAHTFDTDVENGMLFACTASCVLTIGTPTSYGCWFEIFVADAQTLTVTGFGVNIVLPGDSATPHASVTFPWDTVTPAANGPTNVRAARFVYGGAGWEVVSMTTSVTAGGGTIGGTIANTQVAFGSAANTIQGSATLTYTTGAGGLALNNLLDISGAAGGQIMFPATQNPSANANTLDDYEEGTWTPIDSSGGGLAFIINGTPQYTKIGNLVSVGANLTYPANASANNSLIGGLPFSVKNVSTISGNLAFVAGAVASFSIAVAGTSTIQMFTSGGAPTTNAQLSTLSIVPNPTYWAT